MANSFCSKRCTASRPGALQAKHPVTHLLLVCGLFSRGTPILAGAIGVAWWFGLFFGVGFRFLAWRGWSHSLSCLFGRDIVSAFACNAFFLLQALHGIQSSRRKLTHSQLLELASRLWSVVKRRFQATRGRLRSRSGGLSCRTQK